MSKYIDADVLKKKIKESPWLRLSPHDSDIIMMIINDEMPAADVEPVRHGAWVDPDDDGATEWHCSSCGHAIKTLFYPSVKYCPNCGCKIDRLETPKMEGDNE